MGAYARHTDERANDGVTTVVREERESEEIIDAVESIVIAQSKLAKAS